MLHVAAEAATHKDSLVFTLILRAESAFRATMRSF